MRDQETGNVRPSNPVTRDMSIINLDVERLSNTLALALSSDIDGEILTSITVLRRTIAAAEISPNDLVVFIADCVSMVACHAGETSANIHMIGICLRAWDDLSSKEKNFIFTIRTKPERLSDKQRKWLCDLASKFMRPTVSGYDAGADGDTVHQGA